MHLLHKGFMEDYLCWYAHRELFVCNESMVERMVGSTSSASNVHEVVNDNSNPYKNMVMDAIRMNQGNISQCLIVEEEHNADATSFFFIFWKILMNHYRMAAQITVNYRSLHRYSPSSRIMGWVRPVMIELSNGREVYYLKGTGWKRTSMLLSPWWNLSV
jgi:hypothetical protein